MSTIDETDVYHISNWSNDYFSKDKLGNVAVNLPELEKSFPLKKLTDQARAQGLQFPLLVRFPHILHERVRLLTQAFEAAIEDYEYSGRYTPIYPIKVNQQRRVVEEIVKGQLACLEPRRLGLEAGSKPELVAVISEAATTPGIIVCNGYKDREYIELALMSEKLGHHTFIVIEKSSELDLVLQVAERLNVTPRLGIRARLATVGKGNWEDSGGEKSKFGLTANEIISVVQRLDEHEKLGSLQLLHFHLGSQIANIHDIHVGLQECAQFFVQLRMLGVDISTVDVGGGLGVDYEGTRSRSLCSMNYSVAEYARQVVRTFSLACQTNELSEPDILTESGRAVTAHHAVLIADIVDQEVRRDELPESDYDNEEPLIQMMVDCAEELVSGSLPVMEIYHQLLGIQEQAKQTFAVGQLSLTDRARIEQFYDSLAMSIRRRLNPAKRSHRPVLDQLNDSLADKIFVNFSLFQSLPDVWGLKQIFPVMPLTGLNNEMNRRGVIQDITCDSDGRMDHYVDDEGIETTLPLPQFEGDSLIGFFMVGAYQEILGDMHNLFGDTDSVDAYFNDRGELELRHLKKGDTMAKVLAYVDYNPQTMMANVQRQILESKLSEEEKTYFIGRYWQNFDQQTYLRK